MTGAESRVALHYEQLALRNILAAAVNEFLHSAAHIVARLELALYIEFRRLRTDARAHIDEHLIAYLVRIELVFDEIHLELMLEELGYCLLNELVRDSFFVWFSYEAMVENDETTSTRQCFNILKIYL